MPTPPADRAGLIPVFFPQDLPADVRRAPSPYTPSGRLNGM